MDIQPLLRDLGLFDSDIRIYLYLLENGLSSPPQIAAGSRIARTNTYAVLQRLKEKGLIEEQAKRERKAYIATDPLALEQSFERKREAIHQMLPDLRALYAVEKNKPKIRFYEGPEQIQQIFLETLSAQEIFGFASTKQLFTLSPSFFEKYRKKIKERNIVFHDILTFASGEESGPKAKEQLKGFYDFKLLPKEYGDLPTDILLWEDNIALITTSPPLFGTILTNPALAQTFRVFFTVMWKGL
jgi:HTH-type transcriptional regulator, sugar sensing transcriptional regulator